MQVLYVTFQCQPFAPLVFSGASHPIPSPSLLGHRGHVRKIGRMLQQELVKGHQDFLPRRTAAETIARSRRHLGLKRGWVDLTLKKGGKVVDVGIKPIEIYQLELSLN